MPLLETYTKANITRGALVYAAGDTLAMLIMGTFSAPRMLGMVLLGGTLYALEIPAYFAWITRTTATLRGWRAQTVRAVLAWMYFNPLWIARHLALAHLFSGATHRISWELFPLAGHSFVWNLPISLGGNYVIQNFIHERHRFLASGIFSGFNAVYYALSAVWFA